MVLTGSCPADKEGRELEMKKVYLSAKHELALCAPAL